MTIQKLSIYLTCILLSFNVGINVWAKPTKTNRCIENRARFDIGSGQSKLVLAKVDRCKNIILEILLEDAVKISIKENVDLNSNKISDEMMLEGLSKLKSLKDKLSSFSVKDYKGVATEVYRRALNGQNYLDKINRELGLNVELIDQSKETILGKKAVRDIAKIKNNAIVWDIGGGSMQISQLTSDPTISEYGGRLASVSFKEKILGEVKKNKSLKSPNPMTTAEIEASILLAKNLATEELKNYRPLLMSSPKIIGIGGLHKGLMNKVKTSYITTDLLKGYIEKLAGLSDSDFGGDYASSEISNAVLVYGFMQAANWQSYEVLVVNLAHGLIL